MDDLLGLPSGSDAPCVRGPKPRHDNDAKNGAAGSRSPTGATSQSESGASPPSSVAGGSGARSWEDDGSFSTNDDEISFSSADDAVLDGGGEQNGSQGPPSVHSSPSSTSGPPRGSPSGQEATSDKYSSGFDDSDGFAPTDSEQNGRSATVGAGLSPAPTVEAPHPAAASGDRDSAPRRPGAPQRRHEASAVGAGKAQAGGVGGEVRATSVFQIDEADRPPELEQMRNTPHASRQGASGPGLAQEPASRADAPPLVSAGSVAASTRLFQFPPRAAAEQGVGGEVEAMAPARAPLSPSPSSGATAKAEAVVVGAVPAAAAASAARQPMWARSDTDSSSVAPSPGVTWPSRAPWAAEARLRYLTDALAAAERVAGERETRLRMLGAQVSAMAESHRRLFGVPHSEHLERGDDDGPRPPLAPGQQRRSGMWGARHLRRAELSSAATAAGAAADAVVDATLRDRSWARASRMRGGLALREPRPGLSGGSARSDSSGHAELLTDWSRARRRREEWARELSLRGLEWRGAGAVLPAAGFATQVMADAELSRPDLPNRRPAWKAARQSAGTSDGCAAASVPSSYRWPQWAAQMLGAPAVPSAASTGVPCADAPTAGGFAATPSPSGPLDQLFLARDPSSPSQRSSPSHQVRRRPLTPKMSARALLAAGVVEASPECGDAMCSGHDWDGKHAKGTSPEATRHGVVTATVATGASRKLPTAARGCADARGVARCNVALSGADQLGLALAAASVPPEALTLSAILDGSRDAGVGSGRCNSALASASELAWRASAASVGARVAPHLSHRNVRDPLSHLFGPATSPLGIASSSETASEVPSRGVGGAFVSTASALTTAATSDDRDARSLRAALARDFERLSARLGRKAGHAPGLVSSTAM